MKLPRLLTKSLGFASSSSSPAERRHVFQSYSRLYSTTAKPTKYHFSRKQKQQQQYSDPNVPPPSFHPRPSEIPYQAKVANSVNLIGHIAKPVQFKSSLDVKSWAGTVLTQDLDVDVPLRIPINFEGDLAHVAACHLQPNDFVHVAGQLTGDPPEFAKELGQTSQSGIQVMVNSLSFVEETLQRKERQTPLKQKEQVNSFSSEDRLTPLIAAEECLTEENIWSDGSDSLMNSKKTEQKSQKSAQGVKDPESSWRHLVDSPNEWLDNRKNKLNGQINPKSPDFKLKKGGVALWLDSAPRWVRSELEKLKLNDAVSASVPRKNNKDDSWKSLIEDPKKWWDNRSNKLNPKYPDFKHKETGEALWLSSSPAWVLAELPPVKTKDVAASQRENLLA